jgi:hypothetical protein
LALCALWNGILDAESAEVVTQLVRDSRQPTVDVKRGRPSDDAGDIVGRATVSKAKHEYELVFRAELADAAIEPLRQLGASKLELGRLSCSERI